MKESTSQAGSRREILERLTHRIEVVESAAAGVSGARTPHLVATGWLPIDDLLQGGLARGAVHEWLGCWGQMSDVRGQKSGRGAMGRRSLPVPHRQSRPVTGQSPVPLSILIHLAWQAIEDDRLRCVMWIGRRIRPYGRALVRHRGADRQLLEQSIFIEADDADDRLWAIDLASRSRAVAAVVADGSSFDMSATRRLQLAAKTGDALVLLARSLPQESSQLSAAATRWRAAPASQHFRTDNHEPRTTNHEHFLRWTVELLRCKGVQPVKKDARERLPLAFVLESDRETGTVVVPADVVDRPRQEADGEGGRSLRYRRTG